MCRKIGTSPLGFVYAEIIWYRSVPAPYPEKFYFSLQIIHICHKPFGNAGLSSERCSDRFIFSRRAAEYSEEPQSVIYFDVELTRVLRVYLIPKGVRNIALTNFSAKSEPSRTLGGKTRKFRRHIFER
jgi:hypothetical protein